MNWRTSVAASPTGEPTSRAMNLDAPLADVQAACIKHKVMVSSIEPLPSGGTRLVLVNSDGAATMRRVFKTKLMHGPVTRAVRVANY